MAQDDSNLKDSWEDEFEEQETVSKPIAPSKPEITTNPSNKKRTTQLEDDFFASLDLNANKSSGSSVKKPQASSINMEAIAAELERKKRLEKAVMDADLENAQDLFGSGVKISGSFSRSAGAATTTKSSWEDFVPETEEQFAKLSSMIMSKLSSVSASKHFGKFIEDLTKKFISEYPNANPNSKTKVVVPNAAAAKTPIQVAKPQAKKPAAVSISGSTSRKKDMDFDYNDYDDLSSEYSE